MSDMTPSEIAGYFDTMKNGIYGKWSTEAAATIRAQAEALKIATEALDLVYAVRVFLPPHVEAEVKSVLARIKEVGDGGS